MKELDSIPTEGQFVVIWEYDKKSWSETCKILGNKELIYKEEEDDFIQTDFRERSWGVFGLGKNVRFFSC